VHILLVRLGDGEFPHVAFRDDLEQAVQLAEELKAYWPHEYVVRDSEGNNVAPPKSLEVQPMNGENGCPNPSYF
jgi:hypothetical protein